MTTATATASKTVKVGDKELKFDNWAGRAQAINDWEQVGNQSIASKARDMRAVLVGDMKASGLKEVEICDIMGLKKPDVQKLVTRSIAINLGLDTKATQELVDAGGNGITKAVIEKIATDTKLTKSQKTAKLVEMGVPAKDTKTRDTKGGKPQPTKASRTAKDIKAIKAIVARATKGDTDALRIYDELMAGLDEVGSLHANQ